MWDYYIMLVRVMIVGPAVLLIIIIIIIIFLTPVLNSRGKKKLRYAI